MPDKPAAEVTITEVIVRRLLTTQASALGDTTRLPLREVSAGWDCSIWRLGDDLAVRLPRRTAAAALVDHEVVALPVLAPRLARAGVQTPCPVLAGEPGGGFPWRWSIVPWIEGSVALDVPRAERTAWVADLAAVLHALHLPATDFPRNPVRGVPLRERAQAVSARIGRLRARGALARDQIAHLERDWARGLAAPPWRTAPVWIHGDLHPGNLVVDARRLVGVIDFGDVTAGDPAYDLAVAWLAFDATGARALRARSADAYDDATWTRARAWAAAVALLLLDGSDDDPPYAALARETAAVLRDTADS